jgi:hypothetical protein
MINIFSGTQVCDSFQHPHFAFGEDLFMKLRTLFALLTSIQIHSYLASFCLNYSKIEVFLCVFMTE